MPSTVTASLAVAALFFTNVEGHGRMTNPPGRGISALYLKNSGPLINITPNEIQIGPIELLSQFNQADYPPAPTFNLLNGCRGTVYEEGNNVTTLSPGEDLEVKWSISAPHPGSLTLSILKPTSDANNVITYESYKVLSEIKPFAESGGDNSTIVQIPADVAGCSTPGDCVLQFNWFSDIATQTYITCADIVVSGSGASTSSTPSAASAPVSSTPTTPASSPAPATAVTPADSASPATSTPSTTPPTPATSAAPATPAPMAQNEEVGTPTTPASSPAPATAVTPSDSASPATSTPSTTPPTPATSAAPVTPAPMAQNEEVGGEAKSGAKCSRRN